MWLVSERNYMKKFLLLFLSICFISQIAGAQALWQLKKYEVSAGLGPTFFFGDVGGFTPGANSLGFKDFTILQTHANLSFSFKYRIQDNITGRLNFSGGYLKATDRRGSNEGRKFEATTNFFEPLILGEYYFLKNRLERSYRFQSRGKRTATLMRSFDFYLFSGVGVISYSVKGNSELKRTKGFQSGGFAPVIPLGVGSRYIFSREIDLGLELCGRYAFSDYIDGYTSQYSKYNDVYYSLNFVFIYKIKPNKNF